MRFLFLLLSIFMLGCRKNAASENPCLRSEIDFFLSSGQACPNGASVKEYLLQGKKFYAFAVGNCVSDTWIDVLDENCNLAGRLGTIAGLTKINGVDFYQNAVLLRTVWEN